MTNILILVFALLASSTLQAKDDVVPLEYLNTLVSESTTYDPTSGVTCFPVEAMFEEPKLFDVCWNISLLKAYSSLKMQLTLHNL